MKFKMGRVPQKMELRHISSLQNYEHLKTARLKAKKLSAYHSTIHGIGVLVLAIKKIIKSGQI